MEEEDNSITMVDVLKEQEAFEEDAKAVLGASDDKNCTYLLGYVKRQALYACLSCCPDSVTDPELRAGVCLACSLACHENHNLVELYTKRNFRCDCAGPKLPNRCTFNTKKSENNTQNEYNQNFSGLYCTCHRPYPDPDDSVEDEMIQCIVCEDWFHSRHLNAKLPVAGHYSEMICESCTQKNDFLQNYMCFEANYRINSETNNVDVETLDATKQSSCDESTNKEENRTAISSVGEPDTVVDGLNATNINIDDSGKADLTGVDQSSSNVGLTSTMETTLGGQHEDSTASKDNSIPQNMEHTGICNNEDGHEANDESVTTVVTSDIEMNDAFQNQQTDGPNQNIADSTIEDVSPTSESQLETDVTVNVPGENEEAKCIDNASNSDIIDTNTLDKPNITQDENSKIMESGEEVSMNDKDGLNPVTTALDGGQSESTTNLIAELNTDGNQLLMSLQNKDECIIDAGESLIENSTVTEQLKPQVADLNIVAEQKQTNDEITALVLEQPQIDTSSISEEQKMANESETPIGIVSEQQQSINESKHSSTIVAEQETTVDESEHPNAIIAEQDTMADENEHSTNIAKQPTVDERELSPVTTEQLETLNENEHPTDFIDEQPKTVDENEDITDVNAEKPKIVDENEDITDVDAEKPETVDANEDITDVNAEKPKTVDANEDITDVNAEKPKTVDANEDITDVDAEKHKTVDENEDITDVNTEQPKTADENEDITDVNAEQQKMVDENEGITDVNTEQPKTVDEKQNTTDIIADQPKTVDENEDISDVNAEQLKTADENEHISEQLKTIDEKQNTTDTIAEQSNVIEQQSQIENKDASNDSKETQIVNENNGTDMVTEIENNDSISDSQNKSNVENMEVECSHESQPENGETPVIDNASITNGVEGTAEHEVTDSTVCASKRKSEEECAAETQASKKMRRDHEVSTVSCVKPESDTSYTFKGATFWPSDWRSKLCKCRSCSYIYAEKKVAFILDLEDTVSAYEDLGKIKLESGSSQYEKGMEALSSLGHVQQINAITEYNRMKEKLLEFLKTFKDKKEVVKEEDIKGFFAGMKPKREPDGVYFCR